MAQTRCSLCFKLKECQSPLPLAAAICRGCFLDLDRIQGWLESVGYGLYHGETGQMIGGFQGMQTTAAAINPPNPPAEPVQPPVYQQDELIPKKRAK